MKLLLVFGVEGEFASRYPKKMDALWRKIGYDKVKPFTLKALALRDAYKALPLNNRPLTDQAIESLSLPRKLADVLKAGCYHSEYWGQ